MYSLFQYLLQSSRRFIVLPLLITGLLACMGTASAQICADWGGDPIQLRSETPAAGPDLLVWDGDTV